MQSENSFSKILELQKCLEDPEAKNNLLGFFETLIEIAKENPELIQKNLNLNNKEMEINTKDNND